MTASEFKNWPASIRVKSGSIRERKAPSANALIPTISDNELQHADAPLTIVASEIYSERSNLPKDGGSDGHKYVRGIVMADITTAVALCRDLHRHVDARCLSVIVTRLAECVDGGRRQLHMQLRISPTKVKEYFCIARIMPGVSDAIDRSDVWPTHENLFYVSKGKTQDEQLARWNTITSEGCKSVASRRPLPKSRAALISKIVDALEWCEELAIAVGPMLVEETTSENEEELQRCDELLIQVSVLLGRSGERGQPTYGSADQDDGYRMDRGAARLSAGHKN